MFAVYVLPRASRQLMRASAWWSEHRREAPSLVADELATLLVSLRTFPERGATVGRGRRRLITETTRLLVIYRVRPRLRRVDVLEIRAP